MVGFMDAAAERAVPAILVAMIAAMILDEDKRATA
jgi:hypothetical protein